MFLKSRMLEQQPFFAVLIRQFLQLPSRKVLKSPMKPYCPNTKNRGNRLGNRTLSLTEMRKHRGSFTRRYLTYVRALRQREVMYLLLQRVWREIFTRDTYFGMPMSGCFLHCFLLTLMQPLTLLDTETRSTKPVPLGKVHIRVKSVRRVAFQMAVM